MSRVNLICVVLLTFVVIKLKLAVCETDKAAQNNTNVLSVSELYSELNVVSDNICSNHEKNVAVDVILIDSRARGHENHHVNKRQAPLHDKRRDFKDRPREDQKSLLIIFDGTGSMHDDLAQLRSGAQEIINDLSSREDSPIFNYILVVFRDPNVEPPFETRNPDELLERLKYIEITGGGDCPEMTLSGLRIALKFALPSSLAFVFSDASSKDAYMYDDVVELIQTKQVTVNFLITGDCNAQESLGYKVYQKLSRVSNGQVYDMNKNNVKDVLLAIRHTLSHSYAALKSVDVENAGTSKTDLNVDKSIFELSVSITGENANLLIRDPSNETVQSSDSLTLKNLKLVNIKDPMDGVWKIEAKADSPHSLRLSALSDLKFEFGFSIDSVERKSQTSFQPLKGHTNILSVFTSEPELVNTLSNVTIILVPSNPLENSIKFTIPLKKQSDSVYSTNSFEVPKSMFKIQLNGIDVNGNSIERLISTGLISSYGTVPEVDVEISQKEIYENEKLYLKCLVKSHIPVNITWSFNDKEVKQLFSNQSNDLELNIEEVQLNNSGVYKCLSVNSIGSQAYEVTVQVLMTPKVKISIDSNEMMANVKYSLKCNIEGMKEGKVEILWLDEDENILQKGSSIYYFIAEAELNNKTVKCRAQSNEFTIEDSIVLRVNYPPKFVNNISHNDSVVFGSIINLDCLTEENPEKDLSQWYFTNSEVRQTISNEGDHYELQVFNDNEGLYECIMQNKYGSVHRQFKINLTPKEAPKIHSANDIQIVNQSDSIELLCECKNCLPLTNFTWSNENLKNYENNFIINEEENSFKFILKVKNVSDDDSGSFQCSMMNKLGEDKVSIELLVQTIPIIEEISMINDESKMKMNETVDALEGESLSLECIVNGFPEPLIFWTKNEEKFSEEALLEFKNISIEDDGKYMCVSENILGMTTKQFDLNVNYPPRRNKRSVINTQLEFNENSRVTLKCELIGNPKLKISWQKNSKSIDENEKYKLSAEALQFDANEHDSGVYTCIGINKYGNASIDFTVIILSIPKILQSNDEVIKVRSERPLKLSCDATGYPTPKIRFVKDDIILSSESTFELEYATFNLTGTIHCFAENQVGSAEKIFYITVVEPAKIISTFNNVTLLTNQTHEAICITKGFPVPTIKWMLDDEIVLSTQEVLNLNSTMKSGKVKCISENTEGIDEKYFHLLVINEPNILQMAKDLSTNVTIRENDELELVCPYENFNKIEWKFNNDSLTNIEHRLIDRKLIVENINKINSGKFTCNVSNSAGEASFSYDINILASPIINPSWNLNDNISDFLFTESDIDEKVFNLGESLKLNCKIAKGNPLPKIHWRKSADIIGEGEILSIDNLQFHHSDIYTCAAENNVGAVKKFFKIEVIAPPYIDDAITVQKHFHKSIGDSVILRCSSIIANPLPLYFWFKNNELLDDVTEDHLEIDNLEINHDGTYRCLAKNKFGSAKIEFHIDIYQGAKISTAGEEQKMLRNDDSLKLSCVSSGNPLPIITWIKNGHIMTTTSKLNVEKLFKTVNDETIYFDGYGNAINYLDPFKIQLSKQKFYSQLTKIDSKTLKLDMFFKNREKLHSSKFNCYSFNALGRDEKDVEIRVDRKPFITEKNLINVRDQEILEHLPILLSCLIDGVPEPKIIWYKNSHQIYENETIKFLSNNKFLSIDEAYSWHSGNYSCIGKNNDGELELKFNILILAPPRISNYTILTSQNRNFYHDKSKSLENNGSSENENTINVLRGEDVILECWIVGASPKAKIHWVKLNFFDSSKNENLKEEKNVLTLNSVQESSNYMCHANNTMGTVQKLFFINVNFSPKFINNNSDKIEEHVTAKLHHSINFDCKNKASPEAETFWNFNSENLTKLHNDFYFTSDNQIARIINVQKNHEGKLTCTSYNSLGLIQKIFYITVKVPVQYSPWSEWSTCSVSCGLNGVQYRSRTCILLNAMPSYNCSGENIQIRKCNDIACPIDGGWSDFSAWSSCPKCFDEKSSKKPMQKRYRKCDSPLPSFGGLQCEGTEVDERECEIRYCPINGGWSVWNSWSACSKTCGKGFRTRKRFCNNPVNKYNGKFCEGENTEYEECKAKPCSNFNLRKSLDSDHSDDIESDSTERFGEIAEFEVRNDENGESRIYQFTQHREIEFSPAPRERNAQNLPKIKVTLDTYKPISKDDYSKHLNDLASNSADNEGEQLDDDYFEYNASTEILSSFEIENTTIRNCGNGFKYNPAYKQCEEVDECKLKELNNCKRNEKCINTIGSYRCERLK